MSKQKIIGTFLILILSLVTFSNVSAQKLSSSAELSLLTCSPGEELYTLFGHSGLRIKDLENNIDIVFGYGTFDFTTPNFYTKFARGKLNYMLSYGHFARFKKVYIHEGRGITEQKLNLDSIEKQQLFNALLINFKPENRFYKYDFLFDNCSTRINEIIAENTTNKIIFNTKVSEVKTFWNLLDPFMEKSRWIYFGIHLALGKPCDTDATPYQHMFLPDNMMKGFETAEIARKNGNEPLVKSTKVILQPTFKSVLTKWYKRPAFVFGLIALFGLLLSISFLKKKKNLFAFDVLIFGATGLLGWVIIFLWFFTDHQATGPNWNIIWAFPLHFPLIFRLLKKKPSLFTYYYFLFHFVILTVLLASWPIFPQSFPNEILPFIALLLIRSFYIVKKMRSNFL